RLALEAKAHVDVDGVLQIRRSDVRDALREQTVMEDELDRVGAVDAIEIGKAVRARNGERAFAGRCATIGEQRSQGSLDTFVRAGRFVETIRHETNRGRNREERVRLQDTLQSQAEILEVPRLTEVRLMA